MQHPETYHLTAAAFHVVAAADPDDTKYDLHADVIDLWMDLTGITSRAAAVEFARRLTAETGPAVTLIRPPF